jgi:hypothetical protein
MRRSLGVAPSNPKKAPEAPTLMTLVRNREDIEEPPTPLKKYNTIRRTAQGRTGRQLHSNERAH